MSYKGRSKKKKEKNISIPHCHFQSYNFLVCVSTKAVVRGADDRVRWAF